jgi:hypothetical protein
MPPKAIPDARGDALWARARANGYRIGANKAKDSLKDQNKHNDKVKKDQNNILDLYVM